MSATEGDALALLALKALRDRIDDLDKALRDRLRETLKPGARWPVYVPGEDGTEVEVGGVTRTKPAAPKRRARITDPAAFLAWVLDAYPDEVAYPPPPPPAVRPAFEQVILARCLAEDGEPFADPATGEALDLPPGVTVRLEESSALSTLQVRMSEGGDTAIAEAVAAGRVVLPYVAGLPVLPVGAQ